MVLVTWLLGVCSLVFFRDTGGFQYLCVSEKVRIMFGEYVQVM